MQEGQQASVAGKIQNHNDYWRDEDPFVLDIVTRGYKLNFLSSPPAFFAENNTSKFEKQRFC